MINDGGAAAETIAAAWKLRFVRVPFFIADGERMKKFDCATMLDEEVVRIDVFTPIREDFLR